MMLPALLRTLEILSGTWVMYPVLVLFWVTFFAWFGTRGREPRP